MIAVAVSAVGSAWVANKGTACKEGGTAKRIDINIITRHKAERKTPFAGVAHTANGTDIDVVDGVVIKMEQHLVVVDNRACGACVGVMPAAHHRHLPRGGAAQFSPTDHHIASGGGGCCPHVRRRQAGGNRLESEVVKAGMKYGGGAFCLHCHPAMNTVVRCQWDNILPPMAGAIIHIHGIHRLKRINVVAMGYHAHLKNGAVAATGPKFEP